jgi:hypothetical protein
LKDKGWEEGKEIVDAKMMGDWNTMGQRGQHRAVPTFQYCSHAPTSIGAVLALPRALRNFNGAEYCGRNKVTPQGKNFH